MLFLVRSYRSRCGEDLQYLLIEITLNIKKGEIPLTEEDVLFKSGANAMKKFEGVGGTLYLTKKALFHKPHKLNIQSAETSIPLDTIKRFETKNDLLIIRNMLMIITKDDQVFKFRVTKRNEWVNKLNEVLG